MALLKNKTDGGPTSDPPVGEGNLSIIARGMRVVGDIETEGVVKVEGEVKGTLRAGRQVLIGKGGKVEGDIDTREAIVGGEVRGSIVAQERIELQATSVVHGDVVTKRVLMAEGGMVNGHVRMGDPKALASKIRKHDSSSTKGSSESSVSTAEPGASQMRA